MQTIQESLIFVKEVFCFCFFIALLLNFFSFNARDIDTLFRRQLGGNNMKRLFFFLCLSVLSFSLNANGELLTKKFDSSTIDALSFSNLSGKLSIIGISSQETSVTVDKGKVDKNCRLIMEQRDKLLYINLEDTSWLKRGECHADFDIKIPRKASLDLKMGSGETDVSDTSGKIKFQIGSGNIKIKGEITEFEGKIGSGNIVIKGSVGNLELRSGSGIINIDGLTDTADIQNGTGTISLKYLKVKSGGELKIRSGNGDSTVYMPEDSKIATDFLVGSGRIYNELGESEKPTFNIAFKAGSGDLKIKKFK